MAKLCQGVVYSKFGATSPPGLTPPLASSGKELRHRYRVKDSPKKSGQTCLPLEYNGEKLDNEDETAPPPPVLTVLSRCQYFDLTRDKMADLYDLLQQLDTLDVGPFQLELIAPDLSNPDAEAVGLMNVYRRAQAVGQIKVEPKRVTLVTDRCTPPSLRLVNEFISTLRTWTTEYLTSDVLERLRPPEGQICIGVEGERALILIDKLNLKLSAGRLDKMEWVNGLADIGDGFVMELRSGGGIGYSRKAVIRNGADVYGTILWDATFTGLEGTARLEIDNAELYRSYDTDLKESIDTIAKMLTAEVLAVFRIDIALDGPGVMDFLQRVHSREIRLIRESTYHRAKKIVGLSTDAIEGFSCGSRQSGRFFRCYNKTKELRDGRRTKGSGYKAHIDSQFWPANGLQTATDNGRLEVELLNRFLKTVEGFAWRDIFDRSNLAALFQTSAKSVFEWVETDHPDQKINRRPRVEFLDFDAVDTAPYERCTPVPVKSDRMQKIMAKRLFLDAAFTDDASTSDNYLRSAADIVDDHGLHTWLHDRRDLILRSAVKLSTETGERPRRDWLKRFTATADYSSGVVRLNKQKPAMTLLAVASSALNQPDVWQDITTGSAAAGLPLLTTDPATCDARSTDVANRSNFAGVEGKQSGLPLPQNPDLLNTEPGNKRGMLDGMHDGQNLTPC